MKPSEPVVTTNQLRVYAITMPLPNGVKGLRHVLVAMPREAVIGWPVGHACIDVIVGESRPVLQHLYILNDERKRGFGLELLRAAAIRFGPLMGAWLTVSGVALARSFERHFGKQPWFIDTEPCPDEDSDKPFDPEKTAAFLDRLRAHRQEASRQ